MAQRWLPLMKSTPGNRTERLLSWHVGPVSPEYDYWAVLTSQNAPLCWVEVVHGRVMALSLRKGLLGNGSGICELSLKNGMDLHWIIG